MILRETMSNLEKGGISKIKRFAFFKIRVKICSVQLPRFCDSSNQICCVVIYLRIVTQFGIQASFLTAKTKLTSLKKLLMPRLELLACVLFSRLLGKVKPASQDLIFINEYFCWTDLEPLG